MRLIIAGGGTGGHVLPAVAVIEEFRAREVPVEYLWIGSHEGVERDEAREQGIPYVPVQAGKLRRYIDLNTIPDTVRIPIGTAQAWRALRAFDPDVIFSSGGYVSSPTVFASRSTPVLTHEQTAIIGLATRLNLRFCSTIALSHISTQHQVSAFSGRVIVTGNPVRSSLTSGNREAGLRYLAFRNDLPVVYVTGGARGASPINVRIGEILPELLRHAQVVHQTGPASANDDLHDLLEQRERLPSELRDRYVLTDYIRDELPNVFAAADLVVARAGAGNIAELALLGKPSILIPLPGSGGGEQHVNAAVLGDAGAALVLDQTEASSSRLLEAVRELLSEPDRRQSMAQAATSVARPDASSKLVDELLRLAGTE